MNAIEIIKKSLGPLTDDQLQSPIETLGIDSIDLVTLRVDLDRAYEQEIPDNVWLEINNLKDLSNYFEGELKTSKVGNSGIVVGGIHKKRDYVINMPQMALEGLSENWLFKEIGDYHWDLLCTGLGVSSFNIMDEVGNRLYATFVRIRYESEKNLNAFQENQQVNLEGQMTRFGESMYFSNCQMRDEASTMNIKMMTTFSSRGHDNTKLVKGKPGGILLNKVEEVNAFPQFGADYKAVRKSELAELNLGGFDFKINENIIFETEYRINPYLDLNGVNLLYFAAYPVISDYCEIEYANTIGENTASKPWAQNSYTTAKDVFYFNNCDINEVIIYRVHLFEKRSTGETLIHSSLTRKSDNALMARIFSVKIPVNKN